MQGVLTVLALFFDFDLPKPILFDYFALSLSIVEIVKLDANYSKINFKIQFSTK